MLAMTQVVRVNFGTAMPLFPLPDAVLLPHAVQPLHIHEPRYRKMISDCLDRSGQLAMATFSDCEECDDCPSLRPAVCIGQIVQHDSLPDGCHNILLHGVCRARIDTLMEADDERPYRMAKLKPIEPVEKEPPALPQVRRDLKCLLGSPRLKRMRSVGTVIEWFDRKDVTTHALLELIGFALVRDTEIKYRLLEEGDVLHRAGLIKCELNKLDHLLQKAEHQSYKDWPKGLSWN